MTENTLGNPHAPVRIDVWADFQCPVSRKFARNPELILRRNYIPTGQVQLVFHPYPILGPESVLAAQAAECAASQGRFWDYHDKLFAEQRSENSGWFNPTNLDQWAGQLGLDVPSFATCRDHGDQINEVVASLEAGQLMGVSWTPTVYVNDQKLPNVPTWEELEQRIRAAGARAA